jgi:hypothetical protein
VKTLLSPIRRLAALIALSLLANSAMACPSDQYDPYNPVSVLQKEIDVLLHKRDYKELDRRALAYRSPDALTSDGRAQLMALQTTLVPMPTCGKADTAVLAEERLHRKLVADWQKHSAVPEVAGIALAKLEWIGGWRKRGGGYAASVTPEGWKGFRKQVDLAGGMLDKLGAAARKDPTWYGVRLLVGRDQGWDHAQIDTLYREAITAFPNYTELYFVRSSFSTPRWGGSRAEFNAFVDAAEKSPANKHGPGILFARLHGAEWPTENAEQIDLNVFLAGYKALLKRYPDVYNYNRLALLGCKGAGYRTIRDNMAIVGDKIAMSVWEDKTYRADCLAFALDQIAKQDALDQTIAAERVARKARAAAETRAVEKK